MDTVLTFAAMAQRLAEQKLNVGELALQNGVRLLLVERGGRVFGPFLDDRTAGLLWVNPVVQEQTKLAQFLAAGEWNLGGSRVWVAPEIMWLARDRRDFWGSLHFPAEYDPGAWELAQPQPGQWRLTKHMTLTAYSYGAAVGEKDLELERIVHPVADPLRNTHDYAALLAGVTYAGYQEIVTLREFEQDDIVSQAWNLLQLQAGGQLVIPATGAAEVTDYNEPVDAEHLLRHPGWLEFRITGRRRFKVGVRAAQTFGRLAYFNRLEDGRAYLLIRNYFNNPSSPYVEEPAHLPGAQGDSIHVYNDAGMFGGFGELECLGQAIGGPTGRSSTTDQQVLWLYAGPPDKVAAIARHLLGVELVGAR
jgi:hypothetical protein